MNPFAIFAVAGICLELILAICLAATSNLDTVGCMVMSLMAALSLALAGIAADYLIRNDPTDKRDPPEPN